MNRHQQHQRQHQLQLIHDWDYHPEMCQIHKSNSSGNASCDNTDLLSFEDSTFVSDLTSSRPPSATSFLDDDYNKTSATTSSSRQPGHAASSVAGSSLANQSTSVSTSSSSVYVMVSGTSFAVPRDAFQKINNLHWQRDNKGVLHLHTSPAIFEVLLSHIVFESLPAYDTLSKTEYKEFEPMALSLGLYDLVEHFGRSSDKRLRSRRRSSILKRNHRGSHIVLNNENASAASSKMMAANSKAARFVASLTRQGRTSLKTKKMKATHDHWCASDHVN